MADCFIFHVFGLKNKISNYARTFFYFLINVRDVAKLH